MDNEVRKKRSLHNPEAKSANLLNLTISYQTLPSADKQSINPKRDTPRDIIRQVDPGTFAASVSETMGSISDYRKVNLVSNAPHIEVTPEADFPDRYQFEIYRARDRIAELECAVLDKNDQISKAIAMLEDEALMWRTVIYTHVDETYDKIKRRMSKIDSTLADLKDIQPHHYPPLEVPERWKKGKVT